VSVKPVDYTSLSSLSSALHGLDAVVSTLGSTSIDQQLLLVEAAAKAGIQRFIPSEFGSNTPHPKASTLPTFQPKVAVQNALKQQAANSGMSYTLVCTGPFLDWGLMVGLIMNVKGKSIKLYDGGHRRFSTTSLPTIGKAVAGVLKHPDATKNRAVYVQDTATTLQELLAKGQKATGGAEGWKVEEVAIEDVLAKAWEELKKEKPNPDNWVYQFIYAAIWGEGYGALFERLDNELLGVEQMGEGEVQGLVGRYA